MGVDDVVLLPAHEGSERAHVGKAGPLLRQNVQPRPGGLDLRAQRGFHLARGNKAHRRARRAQAGQPLQREHGDAVARHRHGEYVEDAHQPFASSAVTVVSYLPVFCAS